MIANRGLEHDGPNSPIRAVLPPKVKEYAVWHYTSPDVAMAIVEAGAFWATSITTMNDKSEMYFGVNLVRDLWDRASETSKHWERIDGWIYFAELAVQGERRADSFVLCASTKVDSVDQWDRYGYVEIGISTQRLMTKKPQPEAAGGRIGPTFTSGWRPVIYGDAAQEKHVTQLFMVLEALCNADSWRRGNSLNRTDEIGVECILRSVVYLKSAIFESEAEVRLYGQALTTGALVEEHKGSFGPSSHISVLARGAHSPSDSLPIVEVRVADVVPEARNEARRLVEAMRRRHIGASVELVETPFRMRPGALP